MNDPGWVNTHPKQGGVVTCTNDVRRDSKAWEEGLGLSMKGLSQQIQEAPSTKLKNIIRFGRMWETF